MSTYLYLVCLDHDPVLSASDESGQHTYDLPQIQADLANRNALVAAAAAEWWDYSDHFRSATVRFLREHPRCNIGIRDEYGRDHPIDPTEPKETAK